MLFKVENAAGGRSTHCGVLEFVAQEGHVYLPRWVSERGGERERGGGERGGERDGSDVGAGSLAPTPPLPTRPNTHLTTTQRTTNTNNR